MQPSHHLAINVHARTAKLYYKHRINSSDQVHSRGVIITYIKSPEIIRKKYNNLLTQNGVSETNEFKISFNYFITVTIQICT